MTELSIFIDESGDFGSYAPHSPYYLIGMVFHDQSNSIEQPVSKLNSFLKQIGYSEHYYIHAGPVIRREKEFKHMSLESRRKLISRLFSFFRNTNTSYTVFQIEKKQVSNRMEAVNRLSKQIAEFIILNQAVFYKYDAVKIYYDNGQSEVTKIILSVFNSLLNNVDIRKPNPADYKLFQAADLVCTFRLIELKLATSNLSKSELKFFQSRKKIQKNFLKPLSKKRF